jgi:hypothetical protein
MNIKIPIEVGIAIRNDNSSELKSFTNAYNIEHAGLYAADRGSLQCLQYLHKNLNCIVTNKMIEQTMYCPRNTGCLVYLWDSLGYNKIDHTYSREKGTLLWISIRLNKIEYTTYMFRFLPIKLYFKYIVTATYKFNANDINIDDPSWRQCCTAPIIQLIKDKLAEKIQERNKSTNMDVITQIMVEISNIRQFIEKFEEKYAELEEYKKCTRLLPLPKDIITYCIDVYF